MDCALWQALSKLSSKEMVSALSLASLLKDTTESLVLQTGHAQLRDMNTSTAWARPHYQAYMNFVLDIAGHDKLDTAACSAAMVPYVRLHMYIRHELRRRLKHQGRNQYLLYWNTSADFELIAATLEDLLDTYGPPDQVCCFLMPTKARTFAGHHDSTSTSEFVP